MKIFDHVLELKEVDFGGYKCLQWYCSRCDTDEDVLEREGITKCPRFSFIIYLISNTRWLRRYLLRKTS